MKKTRAKETLYDGTSGDPTVVSFDPGGVTGWTVISVHPDAVRSPKYKILDNITHYSCGQFTGTEFDMVDQMLALCEFWKGAAKVSERFILLQQNSSEALLSPVRINAAFRYELGRTVPLYLQTPALAKTTITDQRLRDMGYAERSVGKEHARDATRHNFTFWRRLKTQRGLLKSVFPALVR